MVRYHNSLTDKDWKRVPLNLHPIPGAERGKDGVAVPFGCMPGVHGRPWNGFSLVDAHHIEGSHDFPRSLSMILTSSCPCLHYSI